MKKAHFLLVLSLACSGSLVEATLIDFSGLAPGQSVEGLGAVHPLLDISTSGGTGVALFEGAAVRTYGAPNGPGSIGNGGISPDGGFGDIGSARLHDFVFTFAPGVAIGSFSIRMLDFGDLNQARATRHSITFEAWNSADALVDTDVLAFTSDDAVNPHTGSAGDLYLTGDAVTATSGEPGLYAFQVSGADITRVRVLYTHNGPNRPAGAPSDPNIAFDSLNIEFESAPEPSTILLLLTGLSALGIRRRFSS